MGLLGGLKKPLAKKFALLEKKDHYARQLRPQLAGPFALVEALVETDLPMIYVPICIA